MLRGKQSKDCLSSLDECNFASILFRTYLSKIGFKRAMDMTGHDTLSFRYEWKRTVLAQSEVTITWYIPENQPQGTYKIKHSGHYKQIFTGRIKPYSGETNTFLV